MFTSRLVSIDPGTKFCGVCMVEYDDEFNITYLSPRTIDTDKIHSPYADTRGSLHGERYGRLLKLSIAFERILRYFNPEAIACEAPFYHRLHPGAFAPLVETVFTLRNVSMDYDIDVPFLLYAPMMVKRIGAGNNSAKKDEVRAALSKNPQVMSAIDTSLESLSEHAIDAIAVAITHIQTIFKEN